MQLNEKETELITLRADMAGKEQDFVDGNKRLQYRNELLQRLTSESSRLKERFEQQAAELIQKQAIMEGFEEQLLENKNKIAARDEALRKADAQVQDQNSPFFIGVETFTLQTNSVNLILNIIILINTLLDEGITSGIREGEVSN